MFLPLETSSSIKDWLAHSGGTGSPGKLCDNFCISDDLTQMVNFPNWIPDCDSHSPALLDFFLSCDASISSAMAFQWFSSGFQWLSMFIDFLSSWKRNALFHCIAYDYFCADWDSFCDHLRDVPWEDIFKLSASVAAKKFFEWFQIGFDVYVPHRKYQVKHHPFP